MAQRLLATLARTLGSEQAALELKWMRQAVADRESSTSLDEMVRRRSLGEPLQYILGMCLEVIVP
jgi:methylase of polypeptide subunit release factors